MPLPKKLKNEIHKSFSKEFTSSDKFLDLPLSLQAYYFHLCMNAYSTGIVINAYGIARVLEIDAEWAINELVVRGFISPYENAENEYYQIAHWYVNSGGAEAKKRLSYDYRKWREKVIERDGACVQCGSRVKLHAHHIKPFAQFPELRLEINNGITLCETCHRKLHGLEKKDNGKEKNV